MNVALPGHGVSTPECGRLKVALGALDFLQAHVRVRANGLQAASALKTLSQHLHKLTEEAQQQSVQQSSVVELLDQLTLVIAYMLQMSSRIELLAPGLSMEMALLDARAGGPPAQA